MDSYTVIQADREAAAALIAARPMVDNPDIIRYSGADDSAFVQAFAAYRHQSLAPYVEALRKTRELVAACAPSGFTNKEAVEALYCNNAVLSALLSQQEASRG